MLLPIPCQLQAPQGNFFADSIAAGRDLDGDCIPDLVIGDATPPDGADVWFVSGKDGSVLARHETRGHSRRAWVSLDWAGDVDGDGVSEVAVSLIVWDEPGYAEILSGRRGTSVATVRGDQFGLEECSVRAAGNADGDGCPDFLVLGQRRIDRHRTIGTMLVASGRTRSVLWKIEREMLRESTHLGMLVATTASVGDVDGDDRDDVAIAWRERSGSSPRVSIHSGKSGAVLHELAGEKSEYDFGYSLDGGMDFDADGRPDVLVGSPDFGCYSESRGEVRIYSGGDGKLLREFDGWSYCPHQGDGSDQFGECARMVGDVDADGVPEVFVGSPEEGIAEGAAYLCSGRTGKARFAIHGVADPIKSGLPEGDYHIGRVLSGAGDVDLDGSEDVAVCNVPYCAGQHGLVRVLSGRSGEVLLRVARDSVLRAK